MSQERQDPLRIRYYFEQKFHKSDKLCPFLNEPNLPYYDCILYFFPESDINDEKKSLAF